MRLAVEQFESVDRAARGLTRNAADADDLVQETYLKALQACDSFRLREHGIRAWLLRIMHNGHVNRIKRERRRLAMLDIDAVGEIADGHDDRASARGSAGGVWDSAEGRVARAVEQLPLELGRVVRLWAVEEMSYKQIADAVGIKVGTVMSRLHRARRELAKAIGSRPAAA